MLCLLTEACLLLDAHLPALGDADWSIKRLNQGHRTLLCPEAGSEAVFVVIGLSTGTLEFAQCQVLLVQYCSLLESCDTVFST